MDICTQVNKKNLNEVCLGMAMEVIITALSRNIYV